MPIGCLRPQFAVPAMLRGVGALMSTREGGVSVAPWNALNLGVAVGDSPEAVAANRALFGQALGGARPVFMRQVHGVRVLRLQSHHAGAQAGEQEADACISTEAGLACTVQVADCLPVLFAAPDGRAVGAAHAGWRGLAGGVLEATLSAICEAASCEPQAVQAWLGACIGPEYFEVGSEVRAAFCDQDPLAHAAFRPGAVPGKFFADLPQLARQRLQAQGLRHITGGPWCTYGDRSRFFSFRRDGVTGRMAAAIWRMA